MQLVIKEVSFPQAIEFNFEELKTELQEKCSQYEGLIYTDDQIKQAKADIANMRKFTKALSDERIRQKKECLKPYEAFEQKVKELTSIVDNVIQPIDRQVKDYEQKKKEDKLNEIQTLFEEIKFPDFVKLSMIMNEKWLNASTGIGTIRKQMQTRADQIANEMESLLKMPEIAIDARDEYRRGLNFQRAVEFGNFQLEARKRREEILKAQEEESNKEEATVQVPQIEEEGQAEQVQMYTVDFRVIATQGQLNALKVFLKENSIQYGPVPM